MKKLLIIALLAVPALADIKIRVTDDATGQADTVTISGTNRIANIYEYIEEAHPGTNTVPSRIAALLETHLRGWAAGAKERKQKQAKQAEADAIQVVP